MAIVLIYNNMAILRQVNEIYERYVPSSWTKPTPDADQHQREQWILAKYKHR